MALPLPQVVANTGPGGGVVTSMRGSNALSTDMLNNMIKGSQADYAPWTNYANAASKIAYSQFVGPQSIANILNSPNTRGMFSPDEYKNLLNAYSRQVSSPSNAMGNLPQPGASRGNGLLGMIVNKLTGGGEADGQSEPQNALSMPSDSMPSDNVNPMAGPAAQPVSNTGTGITNPLGIGSTQPGALPGSTPTYNRNAGVLGAGTYGASSPQAVTEAGEEGLKAQSAAEGKTITDQWKERQDDIKDQVAGAQEMTRQLDKLDDARSRLKKVNIAGIDIPLESGAIAGRLPGLSDAAQDSDIALNNLVAARLKAWQTSKITNMDLGFGKGLKPGRYMNDAAYNNEVNYEHGLSDRTQEYPAFAAVAQSKGLLPSQADTIWARYANEKPFYDPKSKRVLDQNLEKWEDYLTPESMQETFSPSFRKQMETYRQNMAGGNPEQDKKIMGTYNEFKSAPSGASQRLAKHLDLPNFKSQKEFSDWFKKQDKIVKDAVRLNLQKGSQGSVK